MKGQLKVRRKELVVVRVLVKEVLPLEAIKVLSLDLDIQENLVLKEGKCLYR